MNNVAVALSIYKSDTPEFVSQAIDSILIQDVPFVLFIQVDGPISYDLKKILCQYEKNDFIEIEYNDDNKGLAFRLNQIIDHVVESRNFEFIARMDADDICHPKRFITQVQFLLDNPDVDVVGSDVIEISNTGTEIFYKKMDSEHNIMVKKIIKKCPFNHPSIMFRTSIFNSNLRYKPELKNTQDYYLWIDLIVANKKFSNINQPLLKFRIDDNFHSRRGINKAMNDLKSRIYAFKKLDVLTIQNIIHTINLCLLRIAPSYIKKLAYKRFR
ncbi:glycosyltransferase [Providencia rettgeri]|nr:glycosyltransferase [Providencia rettgeri]